MADLRVKIGEIEFKNPIVMASGTFGFGKEYNEYYDINELGGVGLRIHETPSGIMNSVGLENPGVQGFIDHEMPFFGNLNCVRIANVGGGCLEDYVKGVELLNDQDIDMVELKGFIDHEMPFFGNLNCVRIANVGGGCLEDYVKGVELLNDQDIDMVELNISCPNVKAGGMAFGIKNEVAREVVREVRKVCKHPLVVKKMKWLEKW